MIMYEVKGKIRDVLASWIDYEDVEINTIGIEQLNRLIDRLYDLFDEIKND